MSSFNYRRRILLREELLKKCENCKKIFSADNIFCPICGKKLSTEKTAVYANIGKKGITSLSYKLSNGVVINSKGNMTIPISKGLSYTTSTKKK